MQRAQVIISSIAVYQCFHKNTYRCTYRLHYDQFIVHCIFLYSNILGVNIIYKLVSRYICRAVSELA
jgi:hypothetical protein